LALAVMASAQSGNGSVRGSIRDLTESVIPGAKLALAKQGYGTSLFRTTSNEAGLYTFPFGDPRSI